MGCKPALPNLKSKLSMRSFHFGDKPSKSESVRNFCNQSISGYHNMTRHLVSDITGLVILNGIAKTKLATLTFLYSGGFVKNSQGTVFSFLAELVSLYKFMFYVYFPLSTIGIPHNQSFPRK